MKNLILALNFLLSINILFAQENTDTNTIEIDTIYTIVEQAPIFPGGNKKMYDFFAENIIYPEKTKKKKIQGRVYISFVVEKDGTLSDFRLLKGIGYGCDEEAIRVAKTMPLWEPGSQNGRVVRVRCNIPLLFVLHKK